MQNYFETIETPLFAADFDYFRIPVERWELMLTRLKQLGLNLLTVALPWSFHEPSHGAIDLSGATHSRRNVAGLLNLGAALDFHCILKPGPYSNHGILGEGIPLWLLKSSENFEIALPGAVESWYKGMSKVLAGRQWPEGPVIALQIDSQPEHSRSPAHSQQLTEVKWRIWLRKRYEGIEALNEAYGTDYRSVNDVKFPKGWAAETTPLERDAKEFLSRVQSDTQAGYTQFLVDGGWQVPIYPSLAEIYPDLPKLQNHLPASSPGLPDVDNVVLNLQQLIQVEPDPIEVGRGPVWARHAPIRADGSVRRKFWELRRALWTRIRPEVNARSKMLTLSLAQGGMATHGSDTALKINLAGRARPTPYRLRLNGELEVDETLKATRSALSGTYVAEDELDQVDLILFLNKPAEPLSDFLLTYLKSLLVAQTRTLARCAERVETLGQTLTLHPDRSDPDAPDQPAKTSYILEEARRGLSEADAVLRKAIASIGGLETGFETILGQEAPDVTPQPAAALPLVSPDILTGPARETLLEAGAVCTEIAAQLKSTAATLHKTVTAAAGFSAAQYQQSYQTAVSAAQAARPPLLEIIVQLRLEIASEILPLATWRLHDQIQEIAESLRWGVERG